jgi:hypothetical protein
MDISYIYNVSIKKRDNILFQCKSDDIRRFLLINNIITKCIKSEVRENINKEEEKWLETCLDKLNLQK